MRIDTTEAGVRRIARQPGAMERAQGDAERAYLAAIANPAAPMAEIEAAMAAYRAGTGGLAAADDEGQAMATLRLARETRARLAGFGMAAA